MKVEQGQNIFLNFPFSNGSGAGGRVAGTKYERFG